jgi:hypothetical protein
MAVDPEFLRQQYASLSDQALLEMDRAGLVPVAQKIYDAEVSQREIQAHAPARAASPASSKARAAAAPLADDEEPDWLDDAAEVFSYAQPTGGAPSDDALQARDALEAAGIPCYLERSELPEEKTVTPARILWRLLVPGELNLEAASTLDRDIFNDDFEANWKTHLEALTDDELAAVHPQDAFCGLFDRVDRVLNTYAAERARRGLK